MNVTLVLRGQCERYNLHQQRHSFTHPTAIHFRFWGKKTEIPLSTFLHTALDSYGVIMFHLTTLCWQNSLPPFHPRACVHVCTHVCTHAHVHA